MSDALGIAITVVGGAVVVFLALLAVVYYAIRRGRNVSFRGRMGKFGFGGDVSHKPPKA